MAVQLVTYRFTVQDYHRMAEAGIFHEDDRLELLQGEIVEMPPRGPGHAGGVKRLMNTFLPLQGERKAIISVQDRIHFGRVFGASARPGPLKTPPRLLCPGAPHS